MWGRQSSLGVPWNIRRLPRPFPRPSNAAQLRRAINTGTYITQQSLSDRPISSDDLENYRDRIAFALDIDQVGRILEFTAPVTVRTQLSTVTSMESCNSDRTYWNGCQWINNNKRSLCNSQFLCLTNLTIGHPPTPKPRILPSAPFK